MTLELGRFGVGTRELTEVTGGLQARGLGSSAALYGPMSIPSSDPKH